jgi:LPS sulfotransferase NodH
MAVDYLVCATPRSGSTLLCEGLATTGVAGRPEEYFQDLRATGRPRQPQEYFTALEDPSLDGRLPAPAASASPAPDGPALLERARRQGTTPNGVFGAKVMWGYIDDLLGRFGELPDGRPATRAARMEELLPGVRYVRVVRRERVRQAISLWRAIQTASWRDEDGHAGGANERVRPEPQFDFVAIDHLVHQLFEHERAWLTFFAATAVEPYTVIYEEFTGAYERTLCGVLGHLGIEDLSGLRISDPRMRSQSDGTTEEWLARYAHERRRRHEALAAR